MSDFHASPEFEDKVRRAVSAPNPDPEFVGRLRMELARQPVRTSKRFEWQPAWALAFVLVLAILALSAPRVARALRSLFGYVPEVGLVENTGGLRALAEPVSVTRDGVTLTVRNVFVYADRVELVYTVAGIDPADDGQNAADASSNPAAFCQGKDAFAAASKHGDALLRLPDGTILEREASSLYPQNAFAMTPVYQATVPAGVSEMTMVLGCIPWARLGGVPEDWQVSFRLVTVPEGTVVGSPVIEVAQPSAAPTAMPASERPVSPVPVSPAPVSPAVTLKLERIVPLEAATVFYFSMDMPDGDPSLVSIMPQDVYVVDALGAKIPLRGSGPAQPFEHRAGSLFKYISTAKPAAGPLTLVVANAVAYYAPLYVEPRQAAPEQMSFTFDAGAEPQSGQTWELNREFVIGGYTVKVASVRAVDWEDVKTSTFIDDSQGYEFGYQFSIQGEPGVKLNAVLDVLSDKCWLPVGAEYAPEGPETLYTRLCRDEYPKGPVTVVVSEIAVLLEDSWQATWTP